MKISEDIFIITPCSRPENLKILAKVSFPGIWIVIYDADRVPVERTGDINFAIKGGISGNLQRNYGLDFLKGFSGWVYFLDDDTIVHEDFFSEIQRQISRDKGKYKGYLFNQDIDGVNLRIVDPGNVKVRKIDQGQYILHTDLISDNRFDQHYEADGRLIEKLYAAHKDKFRIIPKVLCHYNYLRR